ncbi:lecithin retinol acyltransferase-like isoform X2 [Girardinichthys multiradiatus]|uniref:lecithin retinol acyltransferase-like isoform X2 n=1 Tax=Girardinichthys multiradiatus TaxID=208333 RepID=UPI001FAC0331|nr:lecithin retinol acyltransferase-like isoform X2 [Girardinichthys multiradiatus]
MFPLQLLALIFISSTTVEPPPEEKQKEKKKEKEEKEKDRYDLMFRRGDLLEVPRTLFTHFGIYLGGGRVAHFIPDIMPIVSSDQFRIKQMVTNTRLLLGVLTKMCSRAALQGEQVARRAEKLLGDVAYSLLWYNCEHFVMYCRYGTVMSFQTFQFCKTMRKLLLSRGVAKVTALLAACLLVYLRVSNTWSVLLAVMLPFLIWMAS